MPAPRTLQLILGPPGSGKTTYLLDAVVAEVRRTPRAQQLAAPPVFVLVPEQQALTIEHNLLSQLAAAAGGGAYATSRLRVLGFSRLAAWLADGAGEALPQLDRLGCRLLAWQLLPPSAQRAARAEELAELLTELARQGATAGALQDCAEQLEPAAPGLAQRVRELAGHWMQFQQVLAARGLGFAAPGRQLAQLLQTRPLVAGTQLFIDGFAGFTGAELQALDALLAQPGLQHAAVTLLLDPARQAGPLDQDVYNSYAAPRHLLHSLTAAAGRSGRELHVLEQPVPQRWSAGAALAQFACGPFMRSTEESAAAQADTPGAVTVVECSDLRTEVDFTAREIARLTRTSAAGELSLRYGEISVVTRTLEPYAELLRARLADYDIRCFIDQRQSAVHHPAVQLVRSGLRLALTQAGRGRLAAVDDVYTLLKCGLLSAAEADPAVGAEEGSRELVWRIENYARELGFSLEEWLGEAPWRPRYRLDDAADGARSAASSNDQCQALDTARRSVLEPVRRLAQRIAASPPTLDVATLLAWTWAELLPAAVQARLAGAAAAGAVAVGLQAGVLQALAELFEQLGLTLGPLPVARPADGRGPLSAAESVSGEELCTLLDYGLNGLSIPLAPPDQDSVLVTEVERGRHHAVRATFVMGLTQDNWPQAAATGRGFSADERTQIEAVAAGGRSPLGQSALEQCEREPYLALVAFTRPSQLLYALYPALDDSGRALAPSPYLTSLRERCGSAATLRQVSRASLLGDVAAAASARDVQLALCLSGDGEAVPGLFAATDPAARAWRWARAQQAQGNRWPVLPEARQAYGRHNHPLGGEADLPAGRQHHADVPLKVSPSRLERFAKCPFQHFAHYGLRLAERPEDIFGPQHLGSFYHGVLDAVVTRLNALGFNWLEPVTAQLNAVRGEALSDWQPRLSALTGRQRTEYVGQRAEALLGTQAQWLLPGAGLAGLEQAQPVRTELVFGSGRDAGLPALRLETAHGAVQVSGRIDRLDIAPDGKALIVDYKLGQRQFDLRRFLAGADLQLPLYLLALEGRLLTVEGREYRLHPWQAVLQGIEPATRDGALEFSAHAVIKPAGNPRREIREALADGRLRDWLLGSARTIASELADSLLSGEISPLPLRDGQWTACSSCAYRSVCRFDPLSGDRYRDLPALDLKQFQEQLATDTAPTLPGLPGLGNSGTGRDGA